MKKVLLLLVLILALVVVYWLFFKKNRDTTENIEPAPPLAVSNKSDAFNVAFRSLLTNYFELKDAFVDWDTAKVNQSAARLKTFADSLPISQVKADSDIVKMAKNYAETISGESVGIIGETEIGEKRKSFYTLSDAMYELLRTVRYDGEVVYHMRCPMAFNDSEEAFWLSDKNQVVNPYLGNKHPTYKSKMLHCGEMTDSLDFRKK